MSPAKTKNKAYNGTRLKFICHMVAAEDFD